MEAENMNSNRQTNRPSQSLHQGKESSTLQNRGIRSMYGYQTLVRLNTDATTLSEPVLPPLTLLQRMQEAQTTTGLGLRMPIDAGRHTVTGSINPFEQQARTARALILQHQKSLRDIESRRIFLEGTHGFSRMAGLDPQLLQSNRSTSSLLDEVAAARGSSVREASLERYRHLHSLARSSHNTLAGSTAVSMPTRPHPPAQSELRHTQRQQEDRTIDSKGDGRLGKVENPGGLNHWRESSAPYFASSAPVTPLRTIKRDESAVLYQELGEHKENFPLKLFRMLVETRRDGLSDIVSFLPHGRAFMIYDQKRFVSEVMPRYFAACRLNTFLKNLGLYSFQRITHGEDRGAYFHKRFVNGKREWCSDILRKKTRIPKAVLQKREEEKARQRKRQLGLLEDDSSDIEPKDLSPADGEELEDTNKKEVS